MQLVRYASGGTARVGVLHGEQVTPLTGVSELGALLVRDVDEIRALLESPGETEPVALDSVRLLPPVDGRMEVWGAGVTYERSREARVEESGRISVYGAVYEAERPELFFKSVPWRVTTGGEPAGLRSDSEASVPEPELAVVVNSRGQIVGATVCDDLTARSIEGENPLYLPQAKTYTGSCVLAAEVTPWWQLDDPGALDIRLSITRGQEEVFAAATSTAALHRRLEDLVSWLFREERFPEGVVLATGTGIVPPLGLTLQHGDVVDIRIEGVGRLVHPLVQGREEFAWLDGGLARVAPAGAGTEQGGRRP